MTTYYVQYPVAGQVGVEVEADSPEEAIEKGWDLTAGPDAILDWEPMERIVQGNVFLGSTNSIEVSEA